jgi:pyridoxine 4-dehydrogenase
MSGRLGERSVNRIGYGAMQLAERAAPPRDVAVGVLRRAVELGVDHIDTAEFYGDGLANDLIRAALWPYPAGLALVSKVGARREGGRLFPAQRPEELRVDVDANLRRLGVERLAAVNLRRLDAPPGIVATGDELVDLDGQLAELVALRDAGKIDGIGLSGVTAEQLRRAVPAGVVCVQNLYNVLDRTAEPLLAECSRHAVAWVPFFPLGSAFVGAPRVTEHPAVIAAAAGLGVTPGQVGLAWLLAHDPGTLLIPGTRSVEHLEENVAAAAVTLDAGTMAALDSLPDATPCGGGTR